MRLISQHSTAIGYHRGKSRCDDVNTVYAAILSIVHAIMAACMEDFDRSISCLGCTTMALKLEQRASVQSIYEGKYIFIFLRLPTGFGKSLRYKVRV